ncbi:MFS general substrate transporter, partial [Amylostereum chailletii]
FNIGYARVSVLFIATFVGYLAAAPSTGMIVRRLGYGRAYCLATIIVLIGNFINCSQHSNFNLMCFGYFVVGNGFANQLGIGHAYFAILRRPLLYMGFLHGTFSLGAFASPLVATVMTSHGLPFNYFYFTSLGMGIFALLSIWLAFRRLTVLPVQPDEIALGPQTAFSVLKMRPVWSIAVFLLLYVGAEDSIGGWIVTYARTVRHATPTTASWISSSFYLGKPLSTSLPSCLAIGRITLPSLNLILGERRAVFIYLLVALALEAVAWAVPAVASTAISTALVGLAMSTFYLGAITIGGRLLPRSVHVDAFALMSSIGQSGSALFPLIVGLVSSKKGIWIVEPTVIALLGVQGACWYLVPKVQKRED